MQTSVGELCILVKDFDGAKKFYKDILGLEPVEEHEMNRGTPGAFKATYYMIGDFMLTLMAPTGPDSTILNRTLEKRGEGLHHFCFFVDEMDTVIKKCQKAGIRLLDSFGEQVELGGNNAYTDPRVTHRTVVQFRPTSEKGTP